MMRTTTIAVLSCVIGMAHAGVVARATASLPDLPAPPQGAAQWVAPSMRMNGLPMTLKAFESRLEPDAVYAYYESIAHRWGHSEFRRVGQGSRQRLSIRTGDHLITVEAAPTTRGSRGTITVSQPPEKIKAMTAQSRFPRPASTRLVNWQEYDDAGIESEHLSLVSARSIAVEAAAFNNALLGDGWQIVRHDPQQESRGTVIEAQRGAEMALLTFQRDRSTPATTAIVIVWRKS